MNLQLKWYDQNIGQFYISGAIFNNFDEKEESKLLVFLAQTESSIWVFFRNMKEMLIVEKISTNPSPDSLAYELDEDMFEFISQYKENQDISTIISIIALQRFEFETLQAILEITQADLEELDEEKAEILLIREELISMGGKNLQQFLDAQLFFYDKEELENFMINMI